MTEWTNPRYVALVKAWRDAQDDESEEGAGSKVRGFILPDVVDEPGS